MQRKVINWDSADLIVSESVGPCFSGNFLCSQYMKVHFFLILLKLKHWWVSRLEILMAIVKRDTEYHFCVCLAGRRFEGSGS